MVRTHGIISAATYYENTVQQKKDSAVKEKSNVTSEREVKSSEDKLSSRAKSYLENLRKKYGDYDFIVADAGDDKKALFDKSDKEISIMFSSSELERMSNDEDYANEKMRRVKTIVDMSERICEQFGFGRTGESRNGIVINKLAVSMNDDGGMSIFAEIEKISEKQKDYIEKIREKRAEEKKTSEEKKVNSYKKDEESSVKRLILEASSEEELIEKINVVNWDKVAGEKVGARFDFSI